ncbi:MAG: hypothetical protein WBM07_12090 [Chitinivibrionales bacterium]
MTPKFAWLILIVSLTLAFAVPKPGHKAGSARPAAVPSAMTLGMDSLFIRIQRDFDEVVASPIVKNKAVAPVNGYFLKVLKENQPFYSLTRVDAKGILINEVIRLVEKTDVKNQNLSKEAWVKRTVKTHKPYWGMVKLEETGRYYLVWGAPVIEKDKKDKEIVEGAVALKIDLWDCFHKFANTTETPFLVRLDRLGLYSNKWKDSISFREDALNIEGIKKISVRYPKITVPIATPPAVAQAPVQPQSVPAVDSTSIKAAQDSIKAAQYAHMKQKQHRRNIITTAVIVLIALIVAIMFIIAPMIKQRMVMGKIDKHDDI